MTSVHWSRRHLGLVGGVLFLCAGRSWGAGGVIYLFDFVNWSCKTI